MLSANPTPDAPETDDSIADARSYAGFHDSADVLVFGRLIEPARLRDDRRGKAFATARIAVMSDDGETVAIAVITRVPRIGETLRAMRVGDAVALNGPMTFKRGPTGDLSIGIHAKRMLSNYRTREYTPPSKRKHHD